MAERKRGLGRGLGALIPDVVSEERPVDVFFPSNEEKARVSRETLRDPAEGMRKSRASAKPQRKTATESTKTTAESKTSAGKTGNSPTKNSSGRSKATGTTAAKTGQKSKSGTAKNPRNQKSVPEKTDVSRETELVSVPGTAFGLLKISDISPNPRQPRTVFDEEALEELVHSIREVGVLQPIVVRVVDPQHSKYELIMGERRFRASQAAGLDEIPAIIREVKDDELLRDALLENLHRADLNPLEEAAAYQQLLDDFQCTQDELSERIGRSRPQITNTLRLLKLPALVQRRVAAGVLSQGHARAILGLQAADNMEVLAQRIVAEGLSVRATEEAVTLLNRGDNVRAPRRAKEINPELADLARNVGDKLDTKVNIVMGKRKGKITVDFANEEDLQRILAMLGIK